MDLDSRLFSLSETPLSDECQSKALAILEMYLKQHQKQCLGYQANGDLHYAEKLAFMLDVHSNNVGDPFIYANYRINTKVIERIVLDYFAKLWHAKTPSDPTNPESYWGYVLSMGSTEGNLYALYNARDYLKGRALYRESDGDLSYVRPMRKHDYSKHAYHPVAFFSQDTHYSIIKLVRALDIRTFHEIGEKEYPGQCPVTKDGQWPREVPSENGQGGPGSIDVAKLLTLVEFFAKTGSPPILILNIGTSFKGAYDDVEAIGSRLKPLLEQYGLYERQVEYGPNRFDQRTGYWIHIDGALSATYLPFLEKAADRLTVPVPKFDFSLPWVHSIVTSAHKFPGCPFPSGVYMTKRKYQIAPPDDPEYIGSPDTTFAGSRNGMAPVVLWCYYANTNEKNEMEKASRTEATAAYAEAVLKQLDRHYQDLGFSIWVERTPLSLTIRFRDPEDDSIIMKYSLSQMKLKIDGEKDVRKYVHIFVMVSTTEKMIDGLVEELHCAYDVLMASSQQKQ